MYSSRIVLNQRQIAARQILQNQHQNSAQNGKTYRIYFDYRYNSAEGGRGQTGRHPRVASAPHYAGGRMEEPKGEKKFGNVLSGANLYDGGRRRNYKENRSVPL